MFKWLTRKNPWYSAFLTAAQLSLGLWMFSKGEVFWGGFFMWCCGVNFVYTMNPSIAPDSF